MKAKYDFSHAKRGAVDPAPKGTTRVTFAVDDEILDWFRTQVHVANGGNYQALMNHALREYIANHNRDLEEIVRRVVRQELRAREPHSTRRVQSRKATQP
ncbi:MAG: BrnA antitoxin family protein [Chloroflexi bacterium]|nr:BrnA antitoxin family protein [Chloroflexota bacterium]